MDTNYGNDSRTSIEPRVPVEWLDYDAGAVEWNDVVRYPQRAIGSTEWAALPDLTTLSREDRELKAVKWLRKLQSLSPPTRRCPRIFISHFETDRLLALKVARIVTECGFNFWLDVLDPKVKRLAALPAASGISIGTSAVIEMAMLNCTHVLAIRSAKNPASPWIDYQFGRIRTRAAYSWQSGSWIAPGVPTSLEEIGLSLITRDKPAIQAWLNGEFEMTLGCPRRVAISWPEHPEITNELP
jgi:hypothetical protein